jgi:GAF domain-containing protein/FixJ family two-component response regulator
MAAERVLVVDDAQGVIDFLSDYVLLPNGYEVLTAVDGEGGLALAQSEKPDLIILDLEMPKMSGMEVLESLNEQGIDIPVIVITFHGSETIAAQTFRFGVKNYITKPFKMEEILESIEQALNESRLRKERAELVKRLQLANKELERRIHEFNILHGIGQGMNSLLRLDDLLGRAVEAAVYVTGAQQGALHLIDQDTGSLEIGAQQTARREGLATEDTSWIDEARLRQVIQSGTATVLETAGGDRAPQADQAARSVVIVPIKIRGNVMGALSVGSVSSERRHTSNDKYLLSVLADYVAVGVENSRLFGRAQRRAEELALLNEVGQAISSTLDLEQALTLVMERVNSMLKVEAGSLMLVDEEAGELVFQIALGQRSDQIRPLRLKIGRGIAGKVAETGQAALILDARRDSGQTTAIDISTDFLARSILCVPMMARGVTIGVIEVVNKVDGVFTEDDRNVLNSIANYAAVAIDNARLFRKFRSESSGRTGTVR